MNTSSLKPTEPGVVILGAGVCGLYAALELAQAGVPVTVLERREDVGGLARGHLREGNHYDLGVHMLHAFDEEIYGKVTGLIDPKEGVETPLAAKIRWGKSDYRYPLQFGDLVRRMPWPTLARCAAGLAKASLRARLRPQPAADAETALINLYGKALYTYFFRDFTTRYWGIPPSALSATFVQRKMPRFTALDVIRKLIGQKDVSDHSGNHPLEQETLHYARSGSAALPHALASEIERLGGRILTEIEVERLDTNRASKVTAVHYRSNGYPESIACAHCLSTIPLPSLINVLGRAVPAPVRVSAAALRHKPLAVFGLLVRKPRVLDALYVYFRERIFHRVGEPKNAGLTVEPADHTVLIVEMTCEEGDARWRDAATVREQVVADLEAEGICQADDIVETHHFREAHAYPIYDVGFEEHLERVNLYLEPFTNLESTGRQGGFCYPNMHTAMRMGAEAAQRARHSYLQLNPAPSVS